MIDPKDNQNGDDAEAKRTAVKTEASSAKIDPLNPPQNMTPPQISKWLRLGQRVFAKTQAAEQAAAEAHAKAAAAALTREQAATAKAARIDALRTERVQTPKITAGKVASFLWMPQINLSLRGFGFSLTLLVQIFAQALIAVGLLPPDHPARTFSGAKAFRAFQVLEEARLNLLPVRVFLEDFRTRSTSGISFLATRQYVVFCAIMGSIVMSAAAVITALARVVFGVAHAYAQTPTGPGMGVGTFGNIMSGPGDIGSNVIDNIFGTGASANSIIGSGLGGMFSFYSTAVLTFAGLIVLWIIISAVAETARTGVPFGKQFNHVWAPIRLVVALGLLVPLGSGLNSGQYIVLSLAKWGSSEATLLWQNFSQNMTPTATSSGQVSGGLQSIPVNLADESATANSVYNALLCQEVANAESAYEGSGTPPVQLQGPNTTTVKPSTGVVSSTGGLSGGVASLTNRTQYSWNNGTGPGTINCGSLYITTPATTSGTTAGCPGTSSGTSTDPNVASTTAVQSILNCQATELSSFIAAAQPLAHQIAAGLVDQIYNQAGGASSILPDQLTAYQNRQSAITQYTTTRASDLASVLQTYSQGLTSGMTTTAKQYGWAYAPVWLINIAEQNARVVDIAQINPTISYQANFGGNGGKGSVWAAALNYQATSEPTNLSENSSPASQSKNIIINTLTALTNGVAKDPLVTFGSYGKTLLAEGFRLITPPNMIDCYDNPMRVDIDCTWLTRELQAQRPGQVLNKNTMAAPDPDSASGNSLQYGLTGTGNTANSGTVTIVYDGSSSIDLQNRIKALTGEGTSTRAMLYPIGMVMISFGFLMYILVLIPLTRFALGILNWLVLIFEAVLAMPLVSLAFLRTDGEGFAPQQVQTNIVMLIGIILRPILMTIGLVVSLIAFNAIMQITNLLFINTIYNLDPSGSDNSLLSAGVYMIFYGTLAYTLANSAFKMIDMLPNFVMGWMGQRMESRVDDASMVQQQAQGYMQTIAYSARGGMDASTGYGRAQSQKAQEMDWLDKQAQGQTNIGPEPHPQYNPKNANANAGGSGTGGNTAGGSTGSGTKPPPGNTDPAP